MRFVSWLARRRAWFLVPLFFTGLVAAVWAPMFSGESGFGWDRVDSYWPDLAYLANQFRKFEFPLWNPHERAGYPAHADPQPGYFYPVHWILAIGGALAGKVSWWIAQGEELLHDVVLASLMYAYLRSRKFHWCVALFGGAAAAITGPWMSDKTNNFMESMAWTPLVWMAFDAVLARPRLVSAAGLAGSLYLAVSAGSPPGYFYVLLMVVPYAVFRSGAWFIIAPKSDRKRIGRRLIFMGTAVGIAFALMAVVILPGLELTKHSTRANGLRDIGYAVDGFIGWQHSLIGLVSPTGGTWITYMGLFTVLCALVGATWGARRDQGSSVMFLLGAVFFLVLAFGSQTPVLTWLVLHVPGFDMFRVCARYRILFGIYMVPTAACGLQVIVDRLGTRPHLRSAALSGMAVGFWALVLWILNAFPNIHPTDAPPVARSHTMLAVAVGLTLLIVWLPGRCKTIAALLALPALFIDPHGFAHVHSRGFEPRQLDAPRWPEVRGLPGLYDYRVYDEFWMEPRSGSRLLLREMRGYQNFDPLATTSYREVIVEARTHPQLLGEYNIRYIFFDPHYRMGWTASTFSQAPTLMLPDVFRLVSPHVVEVAHPAPWVAWYGGVKAVPGTAVISTLGTMRDHRGVRVGAVIDEALLADSANATWLRPLMRAFDANLAPSAVAGRVTRFNADAVSATITVPEDGLVVLNEANYPGWEVFVDGQQRSDVTVDGLLRGVHVNRGSHEIHWRYNPPGFWWQIGLWWLGMAILGAAGAIVLWENRRSKPTPRKTHGRFIEDGV